MAKQQKRIRAKKGRLLLILIVVIFLIGFSKMRTYFQRYTGEAASDGTQFAEETVPYDADSKEVTLKDGSTVYLPDVDQLDFSSEHQIQNIPMGNPSENGDTVFINIKMDIEDHELLDSGLLRAGEAVGDADLQAYFETNNTYTADVEYVIYRQEGKKIEEAGRITEQVTLSVTGSSEYYDNKEGNKADERGGEE